MTHVSVRSSEVQVRTKPALRLCPRPLQNRVWTFLQSNNIPVSLENGLRSNGAVALGGRSFYAWRRLAHLRSSFLYMEDGQPVVMLPPHSKEGDKAWTLRVPVNHRALAQVGPVLCECYWDSVDHDLVVSDVIYYNKTLVWETEDFTLRYQRLVDIVQGGILQSTHEFSDCVVSVPQYETLEAAGRWVMDDDAFCAVFQPEDRGMRRFRWVRERSDRSERSEHKERSDGVTKLHPGAAMQRDRSDRPERSENKERSEHNGRSEPQKPNYASAVGKKMLPTAPPLVGAGAGPSIQSDSEDEPSIPIVKSTSTVPKSTPIVSSASASAGAPTEGITICTLRLDTKNPLPDSYTLQGPNGADYGVAAVRSLFISLELREKLKAKDAVKVQVAWYEPFRKYEVISISC